jgi:type IV pilus assembly protein PilC
MPTFAYTVRTTAGATQRGQIEAADRRAAALALRQRRLIVTSLRARPGDLTLNIPGLTGGIAAKDRVVFTRQFATMIASGLPLVQCLDTLGRQTPNKRLADIVMQVKADVEGGASFAEALRKHPRVFGDFYVNMVEAGEAGGAFDTILTRLAVYLEKSRSLRGKVRGAMTYPAAIVAVAVLVMVFMLLYVIPVFADMFESFGGVLPAPTRLVMALSSGVKAVILYVMVALFAAFWAFRRFRRTARGRRLADAALLRAPVFGSLVEKIAVASFARTLATLVSSGVPILDGLAITARITGNKVMADAVLTAIDRIKQGSTIAEPLRDQMVFAPMVVQMIEVGENAGALDAMLNKIADFYDDEVNHAVEALTSLLEPLLIVILGALIGFMLIAMYLPIFEMAGTLG